MQRKSCAQMAMVLAVLTIASVLAPGAWAAPKYRVLYNFQGGKDGMYPSASLIPDSTGNLYGVTAGGGEGGNGGCGTVFELTRVKSGWAEKVLYRFPGSASNGCYPYASLVFDATGNLYGTTMRGGQGDCFGGKCGVVFELMPSARGQWKQTVLHRFAGGNDGAIPTAGVVLDAAGNVYGTTEDGGGTSCACGTVFELSPQAGGEWKETILHSFSGSDGNGPSGLVFDTTGNLFGVASTGGIYGQGVAFELSPASGGGWNESTIYAFRGFSDGAFPGFGLVLAGGDLYGATGLGGVGYGTIFELRPGSNGAWTHNILYSFTGGKDGFDPISPFAFDGSGNLYGSTGGDVSCTKGNRWGCGNIFELLPQPGGNWKLQVLHTFTGERAGAYPGELTFGGRGSLFGAAYWGGNCKRGGDEHCGVAFEVTP
jgi:uncharacterized repeat protein (TIGR03803 family)